MHRSAYTAVVKPESVRTNGQTVVEKPKSPTVPLSNPPCPPFAKGGVKKGGAAFTPFKKGVRGICLFKIIIVSIAN